MNTNKESIDSKLDNKNKTIMIVDYDEISRSLAYEIINGYDENINIETFSGSKDMEKSFQYINDNNVNMMFIEPFENQGTLRDQNVKLINYAKENNIPIVVTSSTLHDNKKQMLQEGVGKITVYLTKPLDVNIMRDYVNIATKIQK